MNTESTPSGTPACQICGGERLRQVAGFVELPRITSDCRSHAAGGSLFVCPACGGVQKRPDAAWLAEIAGIYADYEAYHQAGGDEQIVFDRKTGTPRRRSDVILENLSAGGQLAATGRALDVGCGNGATLAAMSAGLAGWSLSGYELGDGALPRLARIPRFEKLHTGSLDAIAARFDLVTMGHSLEHFPAPGEALAALLPIVGGGKLFIEVCNVEENPFDILVADHLMHFSPSTLARLLRRCGFAPALVETDWVPKEISALAQARRSDDPRPAFSGDDTEFAEATWRRIGSHVAWLARMAESVREYAQRDGFGVFGTSIAATWIASQMGGRIEFFVDEDASRVGKQHMGRPILHPRDVPAQCTVYLALAPRIATTIAERLADLPWKRILPPAPGEA